MVGWRPDDSRKSSFNYGWQIFKIFMSNLQSTLRLLNTAFTLNKNVKQKAYREEFFDRCGRCGNLDNGSYSCDENDYLPCYFSTTIVDYKLRNKEYSQKTKLLITIINNIKKYNLPIKYGKNKGVVYFEYSRVQCSFHDPDNIINCKPFPGRWTKIPNKKIPFTFVDNI